MRSREQWCKADLSGRVGKCERLAAIAMGLSSSSIGIFGFWTHGKSVAGALTVE